MMLTYGVSTVVWGLGAAIAGEATRQPGFQPYIFWAYGLACAILLGISLWTAVEIRSLARRIDDLSERLEAAERKGRS